MEWPLQPIGAMCERTEQRDPRDEPDSSFKYVDIAGIDRVSKAIVNCQRLRGAEAPSRARKVIQKDDVLVSTVRPNLNAVAMVPGQLHGEIASTGFCVLRPNPRVVVARYLFYWTLSSNFVAELTAKVRGANYPAVSDGDVKAIGIPLPPLSEQRRIVQILDQANRLRRLRAEADAKADRILPALFLKIFGDPETNSMGWDVVRLGRVADVQGGLQLTRKRAGNPLEIPYLRVANVYRGRLDLNEIKTLPITEQELQRTRLAAGDIVVVEGHGNPREIGRCAIWDGSVDPCVHQNHLIRIRTLPDRMTPEFTAAFLNSEEGRQHLLRAGKTTSGINTISVSNVKNVELFAPPLRRQEEFRRRVAEHGVAERMRCQSKLVTDRLWTILLNHAFSGALTASWREAHMTELLQEMEEQAKALAEA